MNKILRKMERNFFVPASQWVQFCKLNPAGQAGRARDQVTDLLPLKALGSGLSGLGIRAKGREVIEGAKGYQLREEADGYQALFQVENNDIGLDNAYFWDVNA